MRVLVTAGNTQTPIDRVRCITNIFTGRTGAQLALEGDRRGHAVTLLTSHPEAVRELNPTVRPRADWAVRPYRTFDELKAIMEAEVPGGGYDVLIHAAAISDFALAGTYAPVGMAFDPGPGTWTGAGCLRDVTAGKVKSSHPELWLRLVPTPKLADRVREPWGFRGTFVKFKLEVGKSEDELREIATQSQAQSDADLIVANTLEEKDEVAFIHDRAGGWARVARPVLARSLWDRIEAV